jgi:hypothetical protein
MAFRSLATHFRVENDMYELLLISGIIIYTVIVWVFRGK